MKPRTPAPSGSRAPRTPSAAGEGLHLVDLVCIAYLAVSAAAAFWFRARYPGWVLTVPGHLLAIAGLLVLLRTASVRPGNRGLQAVRFLYPIAIYAWGWSEVSGFAPMIFGGYVDTSRFLAADRALFGAPPYQWIPRLYSPWLDETMLAFRYGYYLMPLVALWLWWRGRRAELLAVLSIVTLDYVLNYALFPLFPALDPRMARAAMGQPVREYGGFVLAALARFLEPCGGISGGTFPSSHVSASVAWCLAAWRYVPRMGPAFTVVASGVAVSAVYLLYHHGVDSLAGLVLGAASFFAAQGLLKARRELPEDSGG